jgi:hypothetical protein
MCYILLGMANISKEFGDVQVTDLDAKHEAEANIPHAEFTETIGLNVKLTTPELPEDTNNANGVTPSKPHHCGSVTSYNTEYPECTVSKAAHSGANRTAQSRYNPP